MNPLKDRRERLGLTLRDVEQITEGKISNAYLSQLENGKITNPSIAICCQLAAAYAVPLETIAEWVGNAVLRPAELCPTCGQVGEAMNLPSLTYTRAGEAVTSLEPHKGLNGQVIPADERGAMIERAAKAIYAKRPFRTASSRSPWEPGEMQAETFDWGAAPAFYQQECREIAAVALDGAFPLRAGEHDLEMG